MSINLSMPEPTLLHPKILVIGVGGAGGNAVNNMIQSQLQGVDFVVANTDAQALDQSCAERKIQLGTAVTQGLGAGSKPDVGRAAAEETIEQLIEHLSGAHMVFVTAGMGGGTGTGAAPVIAELARERDILTVGVVTKPFQFEGGRRMAIADQGIQELQQFVDTLIVIPNQNLFRIANEKTTFSDAFSMADQVLHSGVRGVTDLIVRPGLINLDFADVRAVMEEMGKAVMGTGEAEGESRATEAAQAAISNPLLDDLSITGAEGVLINITGGMDMALFEVDEAADHIRKEVDPNANIIVGSTLDDELTGRLRVSVVATGLGSEAIGLSRPTSRVTTLHSPARATAPAALTMEPLRPEVAPKPAAIDLVDPVEPIEQVEPEVAEVAIPNPVDEPFDLAKSLSAAGEGEDLTHETPKVAEVAQVGVVDEKPTEVPEVTEPEQISETEQVETHILREVLKSQDSFPRAPLEQDSPAPAPAQAQSKPGLRASLLARVTGVGRTKPAEVDPVKPAVTSPDPVREAVPQTPVIRETSVTPLEPTEAMPSVAEFGEVTPTERSVPAPSDEDQLEIPAFLRRQAN